MKIAVIDNFDSFVFNLVRYLRNIEGIEVNVMRNDAIDYKILSEADGIMLSPGPGIPSEAGSLLKVIEKYYKSKSLFGVCLGHQAIGTFFGAELIQLAHPVHGKSTSIFTRSDSEIFKDLGSELIVGRYHSWIVDFDNNDHLSVTASDNNNLIMAFQHKTYPIYGVQFHPESLLTPDGKKMVENWIESIKNDSRNLKNTENETLSQ